MLEQSEATVTAQQALLPPHLHLHPPDTTCLHPSGAALGGKTPFKLPAEQRQTRLPEETLCGAGGGTITASLNSGEGAPWTQSGGVGPLDPTKRKQWVQLGYDPHGLRLQLHLLRAEGSGGGASAYHLIHCRATPPPLQRLTLTFAREDEPDAPPTVVRATGYRQCAHSFHRQLT